MESKCMLVTVRNFVIRCFWHAGALHPKLQVLTDFSTFRCRLNTFFTAQWRFSCIGQYCIYNHVQLFNKLRRYNLSVIECTLVISSLFIARVVQRPTTSTTELATSFRVCSGYTELGLHCICRPAGTTWTWRGLCVICICLSFAVFRARGTNIRHGDCGWSAGVCLPSRHREFPVQRAGDGHPSALPAWVTAWHWRSTCHMGIPSDRSENLLSMPGRTCVL